MVLDNVTFLPLYHSRLKHTYTCGKVLGPDVSHGGSRELHPPGHAQLTLVLLHLRIGVPFFKAPSVSVPPPWVCHCLLSFFSPILQCWVSGTTSYPSPIAHSCPFLCPPVPQTKASRVKRRLCVSSHLSRWICQVSG